ncbi:hypothetical protein [Halorubellus salinus]|uniref:hypothetical protein n=1 Tax=Halorubellus salinus TaxID=755309 RepID=UPI001D07D9C8|nr:hypothetical protein [Halorubellus salinus]
MNKAFLAVGITFLAIGVASSTVAGGIVWSTFVTLGVVFLAFAFAFGRDEGSEDDETGEADGSVERV